MESEQKILIAGTAIAAAIVAPIVWYAVSVGNAREAACASNGWRYVQGRDIAMCIDQSGVMREVPKM